MGCRPLLRINNHARHDYVMLDHLGRVPVMVVGLPRVRSPPLLPLPAAPSAQLHHLVRHLPVAGSFIL